MKDILDELVIKYNTPEFIDNDPVQFLIVIQKKMTLK